MSRQDAAMSPQLPLAVALLAVSITTLATVLAGIERSRSRRSNDSFPQTTRRSAAVSTEDNDGGDDVPVHHSSTRQAQRRPRRPSGLTEYETYHDDAPSQLRWRQQRRGVGSARGGPAEATPLHRSGGEERSMMPASNFPNGFNSCVTQNHGGYLQQNSANIDGTSGRNGSGNISMGSNYNSDDRYWIVHNSGVRPSPLGSIPAPLTNATMYSPTMSDVVDERRRSGETVASTHPPVVESNGEAASASASGGQRLELLIHNVSHKDMVLSIRRTRYSTAAATAEAATGEKFNVINAPDTALARPKFSLFKPSSELILKKLMDMRVLGVRGPPSAVCAVYRRGEELSLDHIEGSSEDSGDVGDPCNCTASASNETQRQQQQQQPLKGRGFQKGELPVGFDLGENPIPIADLAGYRVRSADIDRLAPFEKNAAYDMSIVNKRRDSTGGFLIRSSESVDGGEVGGGARGAVGGCAGCSENWSSKNGGLGVGEGWRDGEGGEAFITGVYFPLLSVLMPRWLEQLAGNGDGDAAKTVLLVSGVGHPRNRKHRVEDNSTEVTAELMEAYLEIHFPGVKVVRVHSNTNIFRYDDNIRFVKTELLPLLEAERSRTAERYGPDWQDMMHITMSFADGSPARISSINTALRPFRPSFIHIWELKTFWNEKIICEDDIEVHTFEDIDMLPPIPPSEVDPSTALVINEMLRLRDDLERVLATPPHPRRVVVGSDARDDLANFWLRKTKKPVLAVLLVQKKGGEPQLYRGTNMEVSMPTGSLCAERNVIGSALSADLSLLRGDIKAVAVLSVPRLGRAPSNNTTFDSNTTPAVSAVAPAGINPNADLGLLARGTTGAGAGGAGRKIWGGNASATNSVPGSSPQSRNLSPLALTPTFDVSPVWSRREEGARSGGVNSAQFRYQGGGVRGMEKEENSDKERLESFRKVGREGASGAGKISMTTTGVSSTISPRNEAHRHPDKNHATVFTFTANHSNNEEQQHQQARHKIQDQDVDTEEDQDGTIANPRVTNPRFRSESCADELLAPGQVKSERMLDCYGVSGEDADEEVPRLRDVPRSQSFDCYVVGGGTGVSARGGAANQRNSAFFTELSRRKTLRGTKLVRSMSTNPKREASNSGVGGIVAGSGSGSGRHAQGGSNGKSRRREGESRARPNRSSVVAHVPAETLCSNPLKPCGACMEWLKKIAEVNPDFKVITFTDSRCGGVYIEDVAQIL